MSDPGEGVETALAAGRIFRPERCVLQALRWAESWLGVPHDPPPPPRPRPAARRGDHDLAAVWAQTRPITPDCPVGKYLATRGCSLPQLDSDLRWSPSVEHWLSHTRHPAMIGLITDAVTGKQMSLHMTFDRSGGEGKAEVTPARLLLPGHPKSGGLIRLFPDSEVTTGLAIGEGVETCLAAARAFAPTWSALDAGNLARLPVLAGVEAITIVADDDAGRRAAESCATRWRVAGREVRIWGVCRGR